ncbi:MAG: hypothetical protein WAX77_08500 [Methylococcaceae bacterium]
MSEEVKEKDNFWVYIILVVAVFAGVMFAVKSAEHGKYASAEKAIAEDASNSAYRADALHSKSDK